YDRYNNPGIQTYNAVILDSPLLIPPINITIEPETGYMYIVYNGLVLYRVNPNNSSILASVAIPFPTSLISFANNNQLYMLRNNLGFVDIYLINNRNTLSFNLIAITPFLPLFISGSSEPFYNM